MAGRIMRTYLVGNPSTLVTPDRFICICCGAPAGAVALVEAEDRTVRVQFTGTRLHDYGDVFAAELLGYR